MLIRTNKKQSAASATIIATIATIGIAGTLAACGKTAANSPVETGPDAESLLPFLPNQVMRTITTSRGMAMQILNDRRDAINPKVVLTFQGKGTAVTWDIGVVKAAYERMPILRGEANAQGMAAGDVVVTGNSSGALLAAWFSCRGITAESIQGAQGINSGFPESLVKENVSEKFREILGAISDGKEFGQPMDLIMPLVDQIALDGACVPKLPTVILASNQDINDNRRWLFTDGRSSRSFDITDFSYSQRKSSLTFDSQKVGKICTYFADPVMFRYLTENMTQEERLCDVRLIENGDDMKMAILASIAEPTYFIPVQDPVDAKLVRFDAPGVAKTRRVYNGGFSMPGVVQDVKRLFPEARAIGTGRWEYSNAEVAVMYSWYDINLNNLQERSRWWNDLETFPTDAQKSRLLERPAGLSGAGLSRRYQEEINMGYQRGIACLQPGNACLPVRSTTFGRDSNKPAFTKPAGQPGGLEIKTRQGLDPFLQ